MKKLLSILVSILFALSLSGMAFAEAAKEEKAAEKPKVEEKAKKAKKPAKKAKKAEEKKAEEGAGAAEKK